LSAPAPASLGRRLAWFVLLWAAGVATVAAFAWLIKFWLG